MTHAGLPQEVNQTKHAVILRFNELAAKSEKWNKKSKMAGVNVRHPPSKAHVDVTAMDTPESRERIVHL